MSTIATTNIKEPSSATNNITLTSGGDTTISGNATISGTINNLTYPTADGTAGQVLKTDGSGTLSFASPLTYDTAHTFDNTTNEKTFTGIPSTAKRITMVVQGVSAASIAAAQICVRVGTSAGLNTSANLCCIRLDTALAHEALNLSSSWVLVATKDKHGVGRGFLQRHFYLFFL